MRTCYISQVYNFIGNIISLCGWVNNYRNHGKIIFVDLRDRTGIVQVVFIEQDDTFKLAEIIRQEYCIKIIGLVRLRPLNKQKFILYNEQVEILCKKLKIFNISITPPFNIFDKNLSEKNRLIYRILDLRRPQMQNNIIIRSRVSFEVRKFLEKYGFIEIETPILTKSTPEGARDYLVPSRTNYGKFFALPQSPQIFKQMLMMSGFDRYYQIAKCFRDEDLRSDRQPEFTQIDCELSFVTEMDIISLFEKMIKHIFKIIKNINLPIKFPILKWIDSINKYGSDKPDLIVLQNKTCKVTCHVGTRIDVDTVWSKVRLMDRRVPMYDNFAKMFLA